MGGGGCAPYLYWPGCPISQGTYRVAFNLFADLVHHINLLRLSVPIDCNGDMESDHKTYKLTTQNDGKIIVYSYLRNSKFVKSCKGDLRFRLIWWPPNWQITFLFILSPSADNWKRDLNLRDAWETYRSVPESCPSTTLPPCMECTENKNIKNITKNTKSTVEGIALKILGKWDIETLIMLHMG